MTEEEWLFRLRTHGGILSSVLQSPLGWQKLLKDNGEETVLSSTRKNKINYSLPHDVDMMQTRKPLQELLKKKNTGLMSGFFFDKQFAPISKSIGVWNETVIALTSVTRSEILSFDSVLQNCSFNGSIYGFYYENGQLWISANGTFSSRVSFFNSALTRFRFCLLRARQYRPWRTLNKGIRSMWANTDDFFQRLKTYSDIILTIFLSWHNYDEMNPSNWSSLTDNSNLLLQNYFEWAGTEPLCRWIRTEGFTKARWDAVYGKHCNTNISNTINAKSLEVVYFYARPINKNHYWPNDGLAYPTAYYHDVPRHVFFINVAQDAVISPAGDFWTDRLKFIPYACSQETDPHPPILHQELPIFSEVFIVTQFWGSAYFHKMIEGIPRLVPYVEFLKTHPEIKIHMPDQNEQTETIFKVLGLNKERIVTGEVRTKIVYLPQATPCGFAQVPAIQILSKLYRTYIESVNGNITQNSIIMVKRSQGRRFKHHDLILATVAAAAAEFHLEFILFDDSRLPSFEKTMQIFYSARLIIGPHGAGLSNMIFSKPGIYVIEGVCNPPHVNMCFQHTAHILGHHYHGIPSTEGCEDYIDIEPSVVKDVLRTYLQFLS